MGSPSGSGLTYVNSGRRPEGTGPKTARVENRAGGREGTGPKTARAEGQEPGPEAGGLDLPSEGRGAEDGSV